MSDRPDARQATRWTALLDLVGIHQITAQEIRAETLFLGSRHQGRIIEGARLELKSPELSARRGALLRAVIRATPATAAVETDQ
ncbi:hypothetical protein ASD89_05140 [Caulobacter sp. Root656]|nr:hypothetical protein ASD89_05140 [Caulobacter sp. Root656]